MAENEKVALLEKHLESYPLALDPEQVAKVLNVSRRYVDKLMDEEKLEYFVLDDTKERKEKRVNKATLIDYLMGKQNQN